MPTTVIVQGLHCSPALRPKLSAIFPRTPRIPCLNTLQRHQPGAAAT